MDYDSLEYTCTDRFQNRRPLEALDAIRQALAEAPGDPVVLALMGIAYLLAGERAKALEPLKEARAALEATGDEARRQRWRTRVDNVGDLLFGYVQSDLPALVGAASLLVNDAKWDHYQALRWLGEERRRSADAEQAAQYFRRSIEQREDYPQGWFDVARASATLGRRAELLEATARAIGLRIRKADFIDDPAFRPFLEDAGFSRLVAAVPEDPTLREIYRALHDEAYDRVLALGEAALAAAPDKLAILEPMQLAAKNILSDLEEHGDTGADRYPQGPEHYEALRRRLRSDLAELGEAGATSDVFLLYGRP